MASTTYFDKAGKRITEDEWHALNRDESYRRIGSDFDGEVSTIWKGYGGSTRAGRPLIFETAVFSSPVDGSTWSYRTGTEREAKAMHNAAVAWFAGKGPHPMLTEYDLKAAEDRFRELTEKVEQAREARNRIVRDAVAHGWSHAKIASATGLTRARVGQIALTGDDR